MTSTMPSLHDAIDEILPGLIADRRHLHEHPELGMQEVETAKFVAGRLRHLGLEDIRTGIANTGVTALIRGTNSDGPGAGKVVMLRADMDALPIEEENDVDYRSQNPGVMHACGHDAHTTVLLGTARILMGRRDQFAGTVKVLFQPCEEQPPGGARFMIEQGALEDPSVDAAFGLHVAPDTEVGLVKVLEGPVSAASDTFFVEIQGHGGHGAYPHRRIDPIMAGARIISALQALVSRETDPLERAVITVGSLHAGEADNVIPDTATLTGTVRTFSEETRERFARRIPEVITGIAEAMRATATVDYQPGYPSMVNDAAMADLVRRAATDVLGEEHVLRGAPMMGVEDMAYYFQRVPGCFWNLGVGNAERGIGTGVHHPRFEMDEAALAIGVEVMTTLTLRYFAEG